MYFKYNLDIMKHILFHQPILMLYCKKIMLEEN